MAEKCVNCEKALTPENHVYCEGEGCEADLCMGCAQAFSLAEGVFCPPCADKKRAKGER